VPFLLQLVQQRAADVKVLPLTKIAAWQSIQAHAQDMARVALRPPRLHPL